MARAVPELRLRHHVHCSAKGWPRPVGLRVVPGPGGGDCGRSAGRWRRLCAAPAIAARAMALWHRAQDATGSPADTYLAARGVLGGWHIAPAADRTALRYLSRCPHPGGGELPAMLALIRNVQTGEPQAIHRTYLRADGSGKAEVEPAKATLGPVAGGAIMLHPPCGDESLIVAEGIETALAAALLMRAPAWAAVSAGNLERLALPTLPALPDLIVAADHDQPGQRSAQAAATRWREEGRRVRVAMPKAPGADFADLMEAHHG